MLPSQRKALNDSRIQEKEIFNFISYFVILNFQSFKKGQKNDLNRNLSKVSTQHLHLFYCYVYFITHKLYFEASRGVFWSYIMVNDLGLALANSRRHATTNQEAVF